MSRQRIVAVLESMWDWRGMTSGAGYDRAPRWFQINRENFSGRRLYRIVGGEARLLVTNACPELVTRASEHGIPDPVWLRQNLLQLAPFSLLLLCGKVAQETYRRTELPSEGRPWPVISMLHPAARTWTKTMIEDAASRVAAALLSP
jgi:hypothetical protein